MLLKYNDSRVFQILTFDPNKAVPLASSPPEDGLYQNLIFLSVGIIKLLALPVICQVVTCHMARKSAGWPGKKNSTGILSPRVRDTKRTTATYSLSQKLFSGSLGRPPYLFFCFSL